MAGSTTTVFVVFGARGEYSDYKYWVVNAWQTKAAAEAESKRLNEWVKEKYRYYEEHEDELYATDPDPDDAVKPPGDPNFDGSWGSIYKVSYTVVAVPWGKVPRGGSGS